MKRIAKQNGSGGRLRVGLLLATAAALLLVPAAAASAAEVNVHIHMEGTGSGEVVGVAPVGGAPTPIACVYDGTTQSGVCDAQTQTEGALDGIKVERIAAPGSKWENPPGWSQTGGLAPGSCSPGATTCSVLNLGSEITINAPFEKEPLPKFTLTTSTSGTAGSVECKIDGGAKGPCPEGAEEVEETSSVEMFAEPGVGSDFAKWTSGPCENSTSATCSFTMEGDTSADAKFKVAVEKLTVNNEGETGTVKCKFNGGSYIEPCEGTELPTPYGDTVEVVAEAASEYALASLTGTGSASGAACSATETEGSCTFEIKANSSVTAVFESAGTKATLEGNNVHGEVKPATTLATGGCDDVDLGIFAPGVAETYPGTCTVTSTSTGGVTELRAADEGANPGYLENTEPGPSSPYYLEEPLKVKAIGFPPPQPLTSEVTLLTYEAPVFEDTKTVEFSQKIKNGEALRTGTYAKTILLTLEQTTP